MGNYRNIYFIGIGGIGMSAIARYYHAKGYSVSGYDRTPSVLTHELESEGIHVHYEDNPGFIPEDPATTLVVYTPAIPHDMGELVYAQEHGYKVVKRSRILGEIASGQHCLAIAGTHGTTTTSTLLAQSTGCNPVVIRNIRYAEVAASVLTLQRSMLVSFGSMDHRQIRFMNAMTGAAVCLFVLLLGVSMIAKSNRIE